MVKRQNRLLIKHQRTTMISMGDSEFFGIACIAIDLFIDNRWQGKVEWCPLPGRLQWTFLPKEHNGDLFSGSR